METEQETEEMRSLLEDTVTFYKALFKVFGGSLFWDELQVASQDYEFFMSSPESKPNFFKPHTHAVIKDRCLVAFYEIAFVAEPGVLFSEDLYYKYYYMMCPKKKAPRWTTGMNRCTSPLLWVGAGGESQKWQDIYRNSYRVLTRGV